MVIGFTKPRRIEHGDDLSDFYCGKEPLDVWLKTRAMSAMEHGTAVTYITTHKSGKFAGFYSLSANSVSRNDVHGGWLARNTPEQIPVLLLGRFAIDVHYQGEGLGAMLLKDAVERALSASSHIGARALIVDPIDEEAANFYTHFGFLHLKGSTRMFTKLI